MSLSGSQFDRATRRISVLMKLSGDIVSAFQRQCASAAMNLGWFSAAQRRYPFAPGESPAFRQLGLDEELPEPGFMKFEFRGHSIAGVVRSLLDREQGPAW